MGGAPLRITADTNVLIRAAVGDDPDQSRLAAEVLREAEIIAVTLPTLCEFVRVLARGYSVEAETIATAVRRLVDSASVQVDRPAVDVGLAVFGRAGISQTASSPSRAAAWVDRYSPALIAEPSS